MRLLISLGLEMMTVVYDGVQRNVDGGDVVLYQDPLRFGRAHPTTFEASFDESITAEAGIYVPIRVQDWCGITRAHRIWYQFAAKTIWTR